MDPCLYPGLEGQHQSPWTPSKSEGAASISLIERIHQADDPGFASREFTVVFSGRIFIALFQIPDRIFQSGYGYDGRVGAHVLAANRTEGRMNEAAVHSGFAVGAGYEGSCEFLLVLFLCLGVQLFFFFPEPIFQGNHFRVRDDADIIFHQIKGRDGLQEL